MYLGKIFLDIQEKKRVTFGEATWDPFIVVSTRYSKHGNLDEVDQLEGKMQSLFHWLVTEEHPREVLFLYNSNDVMSKEALIRLTRTRNIKCTIPSSWSAVAPLGSVTLEYRSKPESEDLHRTNLTVCPVSNIEHLLTALECLLLPSVDYSKLMEAGTEVAEAIRGKSKKRAEGASSTHTDASLRASRRGRNVLFITIIAVSLIAAIWKVRDSLNSSLQPVSSNSQGASRRSPEPSAVAPVPLPRPSTADQLTTTTVSSARTVSASAVAPPMIQPHRRQTAGEWRTAVTGCVGRRDAVACIKRQIATAPPSCSRQVQDLRVEKSELVTYTVGLLLEACH